MAAGLRRSVQDTMPLASARLRPAFEVVRSEQVAKNPSKRREVSGHDFSRAEPGSTLFAASAAERRQAIENAFPQGLKPTLNLQRQRHD